MEELRKVLGECLRVSGAVLRARFAAVRAGNVVTKSRRFDIQTAADRDSERAIVERIRKAFPGHRILTEEAGDLDSPGATVRWIVDPLDGTLNYRHGFPNCAVSIAVEVEGSVRLGAVYNPFTEELFRAERGRGASCNGAQIRVSRTESLEESLVVAGLPYDRRDRIDRYMAFFKAFVMKAQSVYRLGSAAMDLCHVADGRFGGYFEESIQLWDWAAGRLIVEEAGGRVTDYRGGDALLERRQVCASNGLVHEQMLAILGSAKRP
jgi:myo-inositol-1(or 4)-monophosphatase